MKLGIQDLYFKILEFEGEYIYENLLKIWAVKNDYANYIIQLSEKIFADKHIFSQENLWELYALSRVLDILTLRLQPNNNSDESAWHSPDLTSLEYIKFCKLIGLQVSTPSSFHDFDCEIIEAKSGKINFQIDECLFPAIKLKNLVIKRAGLRVFLNNENFDLNRVNNSKIYWTSRRRNRHFHDLSIGWGSNSQWRTDFRLDIETEENFIYNYEGRINLNHLKEEYSDQLDDLSIGEAIELTKVRHFIHSTKDDSDLFPYDFRYDEDKITAQNKLPTSLL